MEEVPDPRLGLTLSSDLIQDPTLLISFPTEGQRRQQFYWKSFQKGSCHAISLNFLFELDLTRLFILLYRRIEQLWPETLFITSNNLSEQPMNSNNWWGERKWRNVGLSTLIQSLLFLDHGIITRAIILIMDQYHFLRSLLTIQR